MFQCRDDLLFGMTMSPGRSDVVKGEVRVLTQCFLKPSQPALPVIGIVFDQTADTQDMPLLAELTRQIVTSQSRRVI